jgi:hypothetical protein
VIEYIRSVADAYRITAAGVVHAARILTRH